MIIRTIRSLTKIQFKIEASYIKQADIDLITQKYKQGGFLNKTYQMFEIVKLIGIQGIKDGKRDLVRFKQLRRINYEKRTRQQQLQFIQTWKNIKKIAPMLIIWALPMSAPLYFVYLHFFPNYVPTWLLLESVYQKMMNLKKECELQGKKYYITKFNQTNPQILAKNIRYMMANSYETKMKDLSNQELRMVSNLLMGRYSDGTFYLTKIFPKKNKTIQYDYFLSQKFSNFLMKRSIIKFIDNDTTNREQYADKKTFFNRLQFHLQKSLKKLEQNDITINS